MLRVIALSVARMTVFATLPVALGFAQFCAGAGVTAPVSPSASTYSRTYAGLHRFALGVGGPGDGGGRACGMRSRRSNEQSDSCSPRQGSRRVANEGVAARYQAARARRGAASWMAAMPARNVTGSSSQWATSFLARRERPGPNREQTMNTMDMAITHARVGPCRWRWQASQLGAFTSHPGRVRAKHQRHDNLPIRSALTARLDA